MRALFLILLLPAHALGQDMAATVGSAVAKTELAKTFEENLSNSMERLTGMPKADLGRLAAIGGAMASQEISTTYLNNTQFPVLTFQGRVDMVYSFKNETYKTNFSISKDF